MPKLRITSDGHADDVRLFFGDEPFNVAGSARIELSAALEPIVVLEVLDVDLDLSFLPENVTINVHPLDCRPHCNCPSSGS